MKVLSIETFISNVEIPWGQHDSEIFEWDLMTFVASLTTPPMGTRRTLSLKPKVPSY